jgi:hypothetical protein
MFPRIEFDFSALLTDQTVNKLALHWGVPKKVLRAFIGGHNYPVTLEELFAQDCLDT